MNFQIIPNEQTPAVPRTDDVEVFINDNKELIYAFKSYAESLDNCAGLAANQCSLNDKRLMKRIIAVRNPETKEFIIAINPMIIFNSKEEKICVEGCLTWKEKNIIANRYKSIVVEYYNEEGELKEIHADNFHAQIWQHEINHINGVEEMFEFPIKVQNNELCPCGSGNKFKKCCKFK